jgi:hypothetical protein
MEPSISIDSKGLSSELLEFGVSMDGLEEREEAYIRHELATDIGGELMFEGLPWIPIVCTQSWC